MNFFKSAGSFLNQLWINFNALRLKKWVKTPTLLQFENTECGAASLSIILQHFGRYIPLTQLRELCGVSRDGSDAANLIKAARSLGMDAKGFKKGLSALKKVKLPVILFWEFNHFLVLEGFIGDRVALNDPALGPRTVSHEEFDKSFTGIVLTMEPNVEFIKGGKPPSVWPVIFERLRVEPKGVLFVLITGLLLIVPKLVMPIFAQIYLDEVIGNQFNSWIKPLLWAMAVVILLQVGLRHLELLGTRTLEKRLTRRFSAQFEHQVLALPDRYYSQRYAADIAERVSTNASIAEFIGSSLIPMITGLILLLFYLILTLLYSPILGLIVVITTTVNALVVVLNLQVQKDANLKLQKDGAKASSIVVNAIKDIDTVKASAIEKDIFKKYAGYQTRFLNTVQELQLMNAKLRIIPNAMTIFNEVGILLVGFFLVIQGELTLGMLLAAQAIANSLKSQIEQVIDFVQSLPSYEAEILRLEDVLEQPRDPLLLTKINMELRNNLLDRLSGSIEIKNLSFGYMPLKDPLIQELSLFIKPGDRIAFVGGSGSGKSTIAKLIAGLHLPSSGLILYDGLPLTDIPRTTCVSSLAMVQQDVHLYGCSVRDNLTLWKRNIPENEIREACSDAQILDTILGLPDGFETILSEGGRNLSGGQRQRLDIARALVQNPSILILDEATSALDAETERLVDESFRRRGCTQIIVAHRLSTIKDADLILVMENGKVVQQGGHKEMLAIKDSPYEQLLNTVY